MTTQIYKIMNDIYDTWNKFFFLNKKKLFIFSIFTFSKQSFLGIFDFLTQNTPKLQKWFKKRPKSWIALLSFTFHQKKSTFWPFFSDLWHGIAQISPLLEKVTLESRLTRWYWQAQVGSLKIFFGKQSSSTPFIYERSIDGSLTRHDGFHVLWRSKDSKRGS